MVGQDPHPKPASASREIAPDEIILRRLPAPRPDTRTTIERPGIGMTATSFVLQPRPHEKHPSWSRRRFISPERLLELAAREGIEIAGWSVAAVSVAEVRELGLDVVPRPTPADRGHCEIVPGKTRFSGTVWTKLAKRTRVVYTQPAGQR